MKFFNSFLNDKTRKIVIRNLSVPAKACPLILVPVFIIFRILAHYKSGISKLSFMLNVYRFCIAICAGLVCFARFLFRLFSGTFGPFSLVVIF